MHVALLVIRILLAAVFAVAGAAKLADLAGSRTAVEAFGVPARLAGPLGVLLPVLELCAAGALLPAGSARYGAIGAAVLLLAFVAAIARSMARGEAPDCHCFGAIHSEPAGARTLIRNLALLALAVAVAAAGWGNAGPGATAWVGRLDGTGAVALAGGVALAVLAAATVYGWMALLRQNGRLLIRIDELEARLDGAGVAGASVAENHPGLPIGSPAPGFSLPGLYGEVVTLASLAAAERPVLLLFTDPGCGPCNALLPRVAELQRDQAGAVTVAVLTRGSAEEYRAKAREHGVSGVLLDGVLEVYNAYQAIGTPGAVLVDAAGRIASPVVGGSEAIEGLIAQVLGGLPAEPAPLHVVQAGAAAPAPGAPAPAPAQVRPALGPGDPAPALELAGLDGEPVPLVVLDRDTLVLFWNPHCGFCARMLDELRAWEAAPPSGAPRLLLIAAGSAEDNRAMGLAAEIAIDDRFAAGQAFGATGTPTGVLVDATGRIASGLAVGAPSVLALAGVATG